MNKRAPLLAVTAVAMFAACMRQAAPPTPQTQAPSAPTAAIKYAVFQTSMGRVVARLYTDQAPNTTAHFIGLATGTKQWHDPRDGQTKMQPLYDGVIFHRVIPGFMAQTGDPQGDGRGGPGFTIPDEIVPGLTFDKPGMLGMANAGPNTNGSQFFITVAPASYLNGHYSVFGEVVSGLEVVDAIVHVPRNEIDRPLSPVTLQSVKIVDQMP